jgi:hypothetical protein
VHLDQFDRLRPVGAELRGQLLEFNLHSFVSALELHYITLKLSYFPL